MGVVAVGVVASWVIRSSSGRASGPRLRRSSVVSLSAGGVGRTGRGQRAPARWDHPDRNPEEEPMSEILLTVPDMSCDHCVRAISSEVAVVPGVETVDVRLDWKTVRVTGTASEAAIREAVVEAGYEAA